MTVRFTAMIFMKNMYIGADQTSGRNNFNLHSWFLSHDGNTKEDLRHCLQEYHIERFQVF